jgi:hypothetical protein
VPKQLEGAAVGGMVAASTFMHVVLGAARVLIAGAVSFCVVPGSAPAVMAASVSMYVVLGSAPAVAEAPAGFDVLWSFLLLLLLLMWPWCPTWTLLRVLN